MVAQYTIFGRQVGSHVASAPLAGLNRPLQAWISMYIISH